MQSYGNMYSRDYNIGLSNLVVKWIESLDVEAEDDSDDAANGLAGDAVLRVRLCPTHCQDMYLDYEGQLWVLFLNIKLGRLFCSPSWKIRTTNRIFQIAKQTGSLLLFKGQVLLQQRKEETEVRGPDVFFAFFLSLFSKSPWSVVGFVGAVNFVWRSISPGEWVRTYTEWSVS